MMLKIKFFKGNPDRKYTLYLHNRQQTAEKKRTFWKRRPTCHWHKPINKYRAKLRKTKTKN